MIEPAAVSRLRALSTDPTLLSLLSNGYVLDPWGGRQELKALGSDGCSAETMVDRIAGCLVGGVVGNALGKLTRRASASAARERLGELDLSAVATFKVSSDVGFLLATAEGLLRADSRYKDRGLCSVYCVIQNNLRRLLACQGYRIQTFGTEGWLLREPAMRRKGNPERTSYKALLQGEAVESEGSGVAIRAVPFGLMGSGWRKHAGETAWITHATEEASITSSVLADLIGHLVVRSESRDLRYTMLEAFGNPATRQHGSDFHKGFWCSVYAPESPTPEGGGWTAAEALSLASHFCVQTTSFMEAVRAAATFGGDHDTVGCITGCIAGAFYGHDAICESWFERVELIKAAREMAADIVVYYRCGAWNADRYPPH